MDICGYYGFLSFESACIRESWSALLPATFVFALCLSHIPKPHSARQLIRAVRSPFQQFLTLHEAEALGVDPDEKERSVDEEDGELTRQVPNLVPLWRTVLVAFVGILECFCWTAVGAYRTYNEGSLVWLGILPFFLAVAWLYPALRLIVRPTPTPPFDLFTLYLMFLVTSIIQIGGLVYDNTVSDTPLPPTLILIIQVSSLAAVLILLVVTVRMPFAIPSNRVEIEKLVSRTRMSVYLQLIPKADSYRATPSLWRTTLRFGVG